MVVIFGGIVTEARGWPRLCLDLAKWGEGMWKQGRVKEDKSLSSFLLFG